MPLTCGCTLIPPSDLEVEKLDDSYITDMNGKMTRMAKVALR